MRRVGVRAQLMIWFTTCLVASLVAFGGGVYVVFQRYLLHEVDRALAEEVPEVVAEVQSAQRSLLESELNENFAGHDFYLIQVVAPDGQMIFSTPRGIRPLLPAERLAAISERFVGTETRSDGQPLRLRVERVHRADGDYHVLVADELASYRTACTRLLMALFTLGPLAAAAALLGGWWLSRRALVPVDRLTQAALSITASGLHRRVPQTGAGDEVDRLATALNSMIERLEQAFAEVRRFTADAAHELRTPLAVLRTGAEVTLRSDASTEQYRQILTDQLEEIGRLSRLTDQLLFLCRDDVGLDDESVEDVRVDTLLEDLCETLQLSAEAKSVHLTCSEPTPAVVAASPDRLRRLMLNLLDNALRHTSAGGRIDMRVSIHDRTVRVEIADTGCGIAAEHLPHVFDRFYRGDASRGRSTGGSGLGLAICRSIAHSLDGDVHLVSQPDVGTTAIVKLPAARSHDAPPVVLAGTP